MKNAAPLAWTTKSHVITDTPYAPDGARIEGATILDTLWIAKAPPDVAKRYKMSREQTYVVGAPFRVQVHLREPDTDIVIMVPAGMLTDLASVPRLARSVIGRVGPHLEAAILHDFLFIAWQDMTVNGKRAKPLAEWLDFANDLFRLMLGDAGIGFTRRLLVHAAVDSPIGRLVFRRRDEPRYVHLPKSSPMPDATARVSSSAGPQTGLAAPPSPAAPRASGGNLPRGRKPVPVMPRRSPYRLTLDQAEPNDGTGRFGNRRGGDAGSRRPVVMGHKGPISGGR